MGRRQGGEWWVIIRLATTAVDPPTSTHQHHLCSPTTTTTTTTTTRFLLAMHTQANLAARPQMKSKARHHHHHHHRHHHRHHHLHSTCLTSFRSVTPSTPLLRCSAFMGCRAMRDEGKLWWSGWRTGSCARFRGWCLFSHSCGGGYSRTHPRQFTPTATPRRPPLLPRPPTPQPTPTPTRTPPMVPKPSFRLRREIRWEELSWTATFYHWPHRPNLGPLVSSTRWRPVGMTVAMRARVLTRTHSARSARSERRTPARPCSCSGASRFRRRPAPSARCSRCRGRSQRRPDPLGPARPTGRREPRCLGPTRQTGAAAAVLTLAALALALALAMALVMMVMVLVLVLIAPASRRRSKWAYCSRSGGNRRHGRAPHSNERYGCEEGPSYWRPYSCLPAYS